MATQSVELQQTDFSAGFISDINPLTFPSNASIDEANFEVSPDGSRNRRRGLAFDTDSNGDLATTPDSLYDQPFVTSSTYSTLSPNSSDGLTSRVSDVLTTVDTNGVTSYDMSEDDVTEYSYTSDIENAYLATKHNTYQAVVGRSGGRASPFAVLASDFYLELIYGENDNPADPLQSELSNTGQHRIEYDDGTDTEAVVRQTNTQLADIASWSGRMLYAFNNGDNNSGQGIGISKLPDPSKSAIEQLPDLAKCRPEDLSSDATPLDTDGAWIYAGDLGEIKRLVPYRLGVLVFTSENIWYLYGDQGYFNPYEFRFDKISATKVAGKKSIVVHDNQVYFWAESGLYIIYPDENTGLPKLQNISQGRIQRFYETLRPETKRQAIGIFNKQQGEIRWLYQSSILEFDDSGKQRYGYELILNLANGAYTKNSFPLGDNCFVMDYVPDNAVEETLNNAFVVGDADGLDPRVLEPVQTSTGEAVYAEFLATYVYTSSFKYVIRDSDGVTTKTRFASLDDGTYTDFVGSQEFPEGVDSLAFIKTGYLTFGNLIRKKTPNWVHVTLKATETGYDVINDVLLDESSCKLTAYWDYANDDGGAKVHGPYEVYRFRRPFMPDDFGNFNFGDDYVTTKNKIRGRGKTVQLKFESSPAKDCRLYSWAYNGETLTRI